MAKDIRRKTRGTWWRGWVKYTYTSYDGSEHELKRATDWEFATSGQAQRAAEVIAGALTNPTPIGRWERKYRSKNDPSRKSRIKVVEIGASRVE